jgi:hypothetical protein
LCDVAAFLSYALSYIRRGSRSAALKTSCGAFLNQAIAVDDGHCIASKTGYWDGGTESAWFLRTSASKVDGNVKV